uniref:Uncharacterized protein n=1 Tax=Utricularia reniformis TaxID=192314 RepID=A0A1Y0B110_9LAMI|nr:hypothetical protein AEK19_MT0836 [Utricularia reniformis]YP_009382301.1 hypothetical protein AEK19_MT1873 [Utricularia reniformis]ART31068.1 hypothetical protein AEK19_MT0836 [Utricularia reniformis]ART32043.1 hypothetical protein AEK19_MT1873 [Utricularia reniformis]
MLVRKKRNPFLIKSYRKAIDTISISITRPRSQHFFSSSCLVLAPFQ